MNGLLFPMFPWLFHGLFFKRCCLDLGSFDEPFRDELLLNRQRTDFLHPFFWDEFLTKRTDLCDHPFEANWHRFRLSLIFFQPVPMKRSLGWSDCQLFVLQLPENCAFFGRDATLLLRMGSQIFECELVIEMKTRCWEKWGSFLAWRYRRLPQSEA